MWTKSEEAFLKKNYGKMKAVDIATHLNKNPITVTSRAKKLGLKSKLTRDCSSILNRIEESDFVMVGKYKGSHVKTEFICPYCNNMFSTQPSHIINYHTKSCGCVAIGRRKGTKDVSGNFMDRLKRGASARNIEILISIEYLQTLLENQEYKCALTGRQLICGYVHLKEYTASVDRIDSSRGYVDGNVQWVHKDVNLCKQSLSNEDFIKMCEEVSEHKHYKRG